MFKRIAAAVAAFTTAALVVLLAASPAQAMETAYAVDTTWTSTAKECHERALASGCVQPYGDVIWVMDRVADGQSVAVYWFDLDSSRSGMCVDRLGKAVGWTKCDMNFVEGHEIEWGVIWDYMSNEEANASLTNYTTA